MRVEHQITVDTPRPFKLLHQTLCVSNVDFDREIIFGYTELAIIPLLPNFRSIRLNCSRQCKINRVTFQNGVDATFVHDDVFGLFCQQTAEFLGTKKAKSLDQLRKDAIFSYTRNLDSDRNGGELLVKLPQEIFHLADQQKALRLCIDFCVEKPTCGVKFVCDTRLEGGSWREKAPHFFSWRQNSQSALAGGAWFPCVDSHAELCTWKIEVSCDTALTAVCSGELQEVSYSSDLRRKNYSYVLSVPSPARNIGLCVGVFDIYVHPDMNELSTFCPPQLIPMLKHTCRNLHKVFEFFEELMSSRYPYGSMKICFVDQLPLFDLDQALQYSSLLILNVKCLYHKKIIDQALITRRSIAYGIAGQFFGCYLVPPKAADSWVCHGLAQYVAALYCQKMFGNNEYLYSVFEQLNQMIDFERKWGGISLGVPTRGDSKIESDTQATSAILRCPIYDEIYAKKSFLVLRVLEKKLGKELLLQVINKLLSVCAHTCQQRTQPALWSNGILLSTESFLKCVSSVTGHDLQSFVDQFICKTGHAEFVVNYSFNRKRNTIELEVKQDLSIRGASKYIGPVSITVQELDGSFVHTVQIDDIFTHHDIQCHSKARRQRKRRIPLWTGEEVDIDLACLDADSPLLWIRCDPELFTVGRCVVQQPDYQWQFQLKHEKDVIAQMLALHILPRYPTTLTRLALLEVVKNDHCFYRVRASACHTLAIVSNKLLNLWTGPPAQISVFKSMFGSKSTPLIPRLNNFSNFQHYFLAKALISSLAISKSGGLPETLSSSEPCCSSSDVHKFLASLCKFNNNSQNNFADDYYRAEFLESFGKVIVRNRAKRAVVTEKLTEDQSKLISETLQELTHALNFEKIRPSYCRVVSCACLRGLLHIRKCGYLADFSSQNLDEISGEKSPADHTTLWWSFFEKDNFLPLKRVAMECIVDFLINRQPDDFYDTKNSTFDSTCYKKFLDFLAHGNDTSLATYVLYYLVKKLTFSTQNDENPAAIFKTRDFFENLLNILSQDQFGDPMMLNLSIGLISTLFGSKAPSFTVDGFLMDGSDTHKNLKGGTDFDSSMSDFTLTPVTIL